MKFINEVNIDNKKIVLRVDYNVPIKEGKVSDDFKIKSSFKTIDYLLEHNCSIILLSHLGRVKEESDKEKNNMQIVYEQLKRLRNENVLFSSVTRGEELDKLASNLKSGEILLLQNTRYEDLENEKESGCDEELSEYWASLGEVFVMDAFGTCHREHASTYGISKYLPTAYGFLVQKEVESLKTVLEDNNKVLVLGGAKVSDKIKLIDNLINKCSKILIGGKMSFTFLKAKGNNISKSLIEEDMIEYVSNLLNEYSNKIILPMDFVCETGQIKKVNEITVDDNLFDISEESITNFEKNVAKNDLVIWNGPFGYVEDKRFENGTILFLDYLTKENIKTVIAGGDTAAIANKYNYSFYHISTGGGATLEYLEGKQMRTLEGEFYEKNSIK